MDRKYAVVSGGSRGIGRGIALALARKGYDVAISYASAEAEARKTAGLVTKETGRRCLVFHVRLEEAGAAERFVSEAARALGGINLLVNNASNTDKHYSLLDYTDEDLDYMLHLNLRAYILAARTAARLMVRDGVQGNILFITSCRADRAFPGDAIYGGIKAGITRMVQSWALDLAPYGIRVNCVAPGAISVRTREEFLKDGCSEQVIEERFQLGGKVPLGRLGTVADIADAVAFLASEEAGYITGISLRVDGGLVLPGMPESSLPEGHEDEGWGYAKKKTPEEIERWFQKGAADEC